MDIAAAVQEWDQSVWRLAALTTFLDPAAPASRRRAAGALLMGVDGLGELAALALEEIDTHLDDLPGLPPGTTAAQLSAQAASPVLQAAALLTGRADSWMALPDEALIAQGEASGQMAAAFEQYLLPQLPGLAERLEAPGARMLDVGTGIGAIARGFGATFPSLRVTGIDVAERVLDLGRALGSASPSGDRVELQHRSITDVDEHGEYDLVWVPAPFIPEEPLRRGVALCAQALRPGGWLLLGHGKLSDDDAREQALTRWKTLAYGGTPLDDAAAAQLLRDSGLDDIRRLPTPPGAPALTVGRRSEP